MNFFGIVLLLLGGLALVLYLFVFGKFKSLGLRILILFSLGSIGLFLWPLQDSIRISRAEQEGQYLLASVIKKEISENRPVVLVGFTDAVGKPLQLKTNRFVTRREYDLIEAGRPIAILYHPSTGEVFIQAGIVAFKKERLILLIAALVCLVAGLVLGKALWKK